MTKLCNHCGGTMVHRMRMVFDKRLKVPRIEYYLECATCKRSTFPH